MRKLHIKEGNVKGFTQLKVTCDAATQQFNAHPWLMGGPWCDWAYMEYDEKDSSGKDVVHTYPAKIYGFVQFPGEDEPVAAVRTSKGPLDWKKRKKEFVSSFELGTNKDCYDIVPLTAIVHPLYVFPDVGGDARKYFCSLPKRCWSDFFYETIVVRTRGETNNDSNTEHETQPPVIPDNEVEVDVSSDEEVENFDGWDDDEICGRPTKKHKK